MELLSALLFVCICLVLICGYPVAFSLAGTSLAFAGMGMLAGYFDSAFLSAIPNRIYGIITNSNLYAVPMFVFMGIMLERFRVAENLLDTMSEVFGKLRGGLGFSVIIVGMLLAASIGIVGATVVTMGLLSLPTMLRISLRIARYGLIAAQITTPPCRAISEATYPIRRMLISRSSLLNPNPFDRCVRTTSPSNTVTWRPCSKIRSVSTSPVVDLPDPLKPVNQMHAPCL